MGPYCKVLKNVLQSKCRKCKECAESGPAHEKLSAYAASVIFICVDTSVHGVSMCVWFAGKDLIRWRDLVRARYNGGKEKMSEGQCKRRGAVWRTEELC